MIKLSNSSNDVLLLLLSKILTNYDDKSQFLEVNTRLIVEVWGTNLFFSIAVSPVV